MANKEAAKKAMRQNVRKRILNRSVRSTVSTLAKKAATAISGGNAEEAAVAVRLYESFAASAGRRNIISPAMVSRKVGRLTAKLKVLLGSRS